MISNKIKNIGIAFVLAGTLAVQSCTSWLDITPEAQVNDKKMFSTPQGFKDVLNGIYIKAAQPELYTDNLLFGFVDVLAQYYDVSNSKHFYNGLGKYEYKNVDIKPTIDNIWLQMYFCIANCNILLEELEKVEPSFFGDERNYYIIRGEAKALRAFFHFDLLRLFAPSYKADPNYVAIPYPTKYGSQIYPQKKVSEVMELVITDLKNAEQDLKEYDPVLDPLYQGTSDMYMWTQVMPDRDQFLSYRGFRMNYYAVNALLARAHSYINEKKTAYDYASIVINSGVFKFTPANQITTDPEYRNRILRPEIVMAFYDPKLTNRFFPYFPGGGSDGNKWLTIKNNDKIFEGTPSDYRAKYLMEYEILESFNRPNCIKFVKPKDAAYEENYGRIAPMIRMSEMYYISCEYLMDTELELAKTEFQKVRNVRNAKNALVINNPADMLNEILQDARREFMCEGQMFYYYKKLDLPVRDEAGSIQMDKKNFVLPLPDVELEFGDRLSELFK